MMEVLVLKSDTVLRTYRSLATSIRFVVQGEGKGMRKGEAKPDQRSLRKRSNLREIASSISSLMMSRSFCKTSRSTTSWSCGLINYFYDVPVDPVIVSLEIET